MKRLTQKPYLRFENQYFRLLQNINISGWRWQSPPLLISLGLLRCATIETGVNTKNLVIVVAILYLRFIHQYTRSWDKELIKEIESTTERKVENGTTTEKFNGGDRSLI
jgi:hypothetical protein